MRNACILNSITDCQIVITIIWRYSRFYGLNVTHAEKAIYNHKFYDMQDTSARVSALNPGGRVAISITISNISRNVDRVSSRVR